jgi:uncharacterized protein YkwD
VTWEGRPAWVEAIEELKAFEPLPPLEWSDGLALAAQAHCSDAGPNGIQGHYGSDGSTPFERIDRYGSAYGYQGENIAYAPF